MASNRRIKYNAIPRGDDKATLAALCNIVETITGSRGDGMEKAVTYRELDNLDLSAVSRISRVISTIPGAIIGDITPDQPQGFTATGTFSFIVLNWSDATYEGHAVTEIYRNDVDSFGTAVKIAESVISLFSDPVGPGKEYYYWIRFRNTAGTQGPINATAGTYAATALDLDELFENVTGMTTNTYIETYLHDTSPLLESINEAISNQQAMLAKISGATDLNGDGVVDADERLVYLQQNVNTNKTETDAGLLSVTNGVLQNAGEMGSLTEDYSQVLGQVLAIENVINDPDTGFPATRALLLDEYYTKTTTDTAIATSTNTLKAQIFDEGDVISEAFYTSMATSLVNENNALSQKINQHTAALGDYIDAEGNSVGSVSAAYESLTQAIANNTDGIISQHIDNYNVTVEGETASLQNWASVSYDTAGKFESQWGVKSQVGDLSNGIGLYNDGENSMFAMVANQIVTVNPITNEISELFSIIQGDSEIPDGVYINTAFIKAATIRDLVAGDIAADTLTAGANIASPVIEGGQYLGGSMQLTAGNYSIDIQPGTTFPLWYGQTADRSYKSVENTLLGVSHDGKVYAKGIEIRNDNNDLILSSSGQIPVSSLVGLGVEIQSQVDVTYVKNLLADQVIAARFYASYMQGDVFNEYVYTLNSFNGVNGVNTTPQTVLTITVDGQPAGLTYDRTLKIYPLALQWESQNSGDTRTFTLDIDIDGANAMTTNESVQYGSAQGAGSGFVDFEFETLFLTIPGNTEPTVVTLLLSADATAVGTVRYPGGNSGDKLIVALFKNAASLS